MTARGAVAAALAAGLLAAGCGGSDSGSGDERSATRTDTRTAESVGPRIAGSVVQYADCDDWKRGTRAEREATVDELRDQLTAQDQRDTTSALPDERAYEILQKSCAQDYAGSLRLYKLFAKAQGFAPLGE